MFRCRRSVSGAASLLQRLNFTGAPQLHATGDSSRSLRHDRAMRCCSRVYRRLTESAFSPDLARMAALCAPREYSSYRNTGKLEAFVSARSAAVTHARRSSTTPDKHERAADVQKDHVSSVSGAEGQGSDVKPSKTQQLRKVFKEYGAVGVSFHIGISLISLGMFYLAVSSGLDMAAVLCKLGFSEAVVQSKMAAGTSTFVLAYAVHKLFAPVRISITLVSVPLIVRHLRKTGLFKTGTSGP